MSSSPAPPNSPRSPTATKSILFPVPVRDPCTASLQVKYSGVGEGQSPGRKPCGPLSLLWTFSTRHPRPQSPDSGNRELLVSFPETLVPSLLAQYPVLPASHMPRACAEGAGAIPVAQEEVDRAGPGPIPVTWCDCRSRREPVVIPRGNSRGEA